MDPGPYFTAGFFTTYDPDSGIDNSALHRGWMVEKDRVRCYLTPFSHARSTFDVHEARGEDMRVAYWVGHHPVACLAAQTRLSGGSLQVDGDQPLPAYVEALLEQSAEGIAKLQRALARSEEHGATGD
jgi:UbiD family decarboxylase